MDTYIFKIFFPALPVHISLEEFLKDHFHLTVAITFSLM